MDTTEIFVVVGGLILIAATLWFFFGASDDEKPRASTDGKPLYACPMHSWITSNDPAANCSICGMKLVRNEAAVVKSAPLESSEQNYPHH